MFDPNRFHFLSWFCASFLLYLIISDMACIWCRARMGTRSVFIPSMVIFYTVVVHLLKLSPVGGAAVVTRVVVQVVSDRREWNIRELVRWCGHLRLHTTEWWSDCRPLEDICSLGKQFMWNLDKFRQGKGRLMWFEDGWIVSLLQGKDCESFCVGKWLRDLVLSLRMPNVWMIEGEWNKCLINV